MSEYLLVSLTSSVPNFQLVAGLNIIGRSKETKISDPQISRKHLQINISDSAVVTVVQLAPGESVRINGTPLRQNVQHNLSSGERISLLSLYEYEFLVKPPVVPVIVVPVVPVPPPPVVPVLPPPSSPGRSSSASVRHLIGQIKEEHICSICQEICLTCHSCPCGHISCRECLIDWLSHKDECPTCRLPCKLKQIVPIRTLDTTIESLLKHIQNTPSCGDKSDLGDAIAWYFERKAALSCVKLDDDDDDVKVIKRKAAHHDAAVVPIIEEDDDDDGPVPSQVKCVTILSTSSTTLCSFCHKKFNKTSIIFNVTWMDDSSKVMHLPCLCELNDELMEQEDLDRIVRYQMVKDLESFERLTRGQKEKIQEALMEYIETDDSYDDDDDDDVESSSYDDDDDSDSDVPVRKKKRVEPDAKSKPIKPTSSSSSSAVAGVKPSSSSTARVLPAFMLKKKR